MPCSRVPQCRFVHSHLAGQCWERNHDRNLMGRSGRFRLLLHVRVPLVSSIHSMLKGVLNILWVGSLIRRNDHCQRSFPILQSDERPTILVYEAMKV